MSKVREKEERKRFYCGIAKQGDRRRDVCKVFPRFGFTLIELLVVISIIALLLSIIAPSLARARLVSRNVICQSNLKQWGLLYGMYTADYQGYFPPSPQDPTVEPRGSGTWFMVMRPYYQDGQILICPSSVEAPSPKPDWYNNKWQWEMKWWGGVFGYFLGSPEYDALRGSYAENWWVTSSKSEFSGYPDNQKYKRLSSVRQPNAVPVLGDGGSFLVRPTPRAQPPESDGDYAWISGDEMRRVCTNRHSTGRVNWVFADFSVRPVGLKELWTMPWHRDWRTRLPQQWPDWMRRFPDPE